MAEQQARTMRRVAFASLTGTTIEFYDFFIYGTAAALVFNQIFFPALGAAAGTALAFATFGVAFVARPFGSILFGHFGDRIGRKRTLISTLLLMGIATVAVGLLPSTSAIGGLAPVLLVILRICQGLAVGGEWAGATLLAAENAPSNQRGKYALYPQLGPSLAFILASATFLDTSLSMSTASFLAWGWRIPFLASVLLVGLGLYVRLSIEETPVFRQAKPVSRRIPLVDVLGKQPKEIILGAGALTMLFAFFYIGVTYLTSYGTQQLQLSRPTVLVVGIVGGLCFAATTVVSAIYSDRVGRRKLMLLGNGMAVALGFVLFPIMDIGTAWSFGLGVCLALGVVGVAYGPAGALLPEIFATQYRYTGAGMAYNLAGVLGGAITPLLATQLASSFGSYSIGVYLSATGLLSLVCMLAIAESKDNQLTTQPAVASP
ncbi:MHS family MFS transporter [Kibdelosporangium philippinense]|uniref:MHS family MFS transporter n=1 Tax=Kibdelosporangium philippinense TaxID=211113 RepID=A0ABS8ZR68_9PSEU|nr:MFS transporter [Kibdelosporangium philippinense]MCE7010205.1 MHS family MFS transporter [Kibdelosporangium philippinense]